MLTSQSLSSVDIQDVARWQFCNTTHAPSFWAVSIILRAMGPCPCPRERELSLEPPNPWSSANLRRAAMGSAPGDRTKISGAQLCESPKAFPKSKGGGSMYCLPSLATTKSCTEGITLSGLRQRRINMDWNCLSLLFQLFGKDSWWGSTLS